MTLKTTRQRVLSIYSWRKKQENSDNIHVQGEAALSLGHQHSQEARNVDRKPALDSSSRACSFNKSELGLAAQDPFQHTRRSFLKKHTQFSPMRF